MSIEDKEFVLEPETLRAEIKKEYSHVATNPEAEFHFHTGRRLAGILEYDEDNCVAMRVYLDAVRSLG